MNITDKKVVKITTAALFKYLFVDLVVTKINPSGNKTQHVIPFVNCDKSDFANVENRNILDTIEYRICPDKSKLADIWMLQGADYHKTNKTNFQLQITKCNRVRNSEC